MTKNDEILYSSKQLFELLAKNASKSQICAFFDCQPSTLNNCLHKLGINYNPDKVKTKNDKLTLKKEEHQEYVDGDKKISSSVLKKKLIKEGIKEYKCECCGLTTWLGKPIPLELHHINGKHYDNRLMNLIVLCPNCHSQAHING